MPTSAHPTAPLTKLLSLRSQCKHWLWQSVLIVLGARVLRMTLLRCPKFLRCLTADAGNFDRGHSLTSLPLPLAALGSLPTTSLRTGLGMTRKFFRLPSLRSRCKHWLWQSVLLVRWATARVAPTECVVGADDSVRPGGVGRNWAGRCRHRPLRMGY